MYQSINRKQETKREMRNLTNLNSLEGVTVGGWEVTVGYTWSIQWYTFYTLPFIRKETKPALLYEDWNSVKWRPTNRTCAVPAKEPATRAPLMKPVYV